MPRRGGGSPSLPHVQRGRGRSQGETGKAKSVVSLEATLLRRCLSGTEKDLFRKHKSYFAHMDDNKAT